MCVPPNLELIKEWLSKGVPERKIAENLGVAYSTWRKWKNENDTLSALFDTIEVQARVTTLENKMYELSQGYMVEVKKGMKVKSADGSEHVEEYTETVYIPPSFNACRFLLTNWSDKYSNDAALLRQREKEFEHKKNMDELNNW